MSNRKLTRAYFRSNWTGTPGSIWVNMTDQSPLGPLHVKLDPDPKRSTWSRVGDVCFARNKDSPSIMNAGRRMMPVL